MDLIERLAQEWRESGILSDDLVMLHTRADRLYRRYRKLGYRLRSEQIVDSFRLAVGPHGGLLFPTFRYDFADGATMDMRHSASGMGGISEAARRMCGRDRTGHPFYSFACFGRCGEALGGRVNKDAFGVDSPFAWLHQQRGKVAILDLYDQHSVTFYHYVEQCLDVDYRFKKQFIGPHVDLDGVTRTLTFEMFVRDLNAGVVTAVNPMGERLWEMNLYRGARPGEASGLRTIATEDLFDATAKVIQDGEALNMLYRIQSDDV